MKKKVLLVITKANWGGAQRYVFDLATHLPQSDFDVTVAYGQPGKLADELNRAGIRTVRVASLQRDVSLATDWRSVMELQKLFKTQQPDIVHLNSSKAGGVGAFAARLSGVPRIIFTVHGWPFWEDRSFPSRILIWVASWLTVMLSTRVICVCDADLRIARYMPGAKKKTTRIYNGIGPMHFGSGDSVRNAFPAGVSITGTIGELNKNKNQIALIEEAKEKPDIYVAIVGEGELRPYLEGKIKEYGLSSRVKLLGFIPACDALKGFDVFELPSLKEGLPYIVLEARVAGLPIVANRIGGIPEAMDTPLEEFSLQEMIEKTFALYARPGTS